VTLAYPGREVTFWQFVSGRVSKIEVRVRPVDVPGEFFAAEITEPGAARDRFKSWIDSIWREKDRLLSSLPPG